jgi:hypothetical protein
MVHGDGPAPATPCRVDPADLRRLARRLAQAIAEVLVRARQVGQLDGFLTDASLRALQRAVDAAARRPDPTARRPTVTSLRLTTPRAGAVEACAVIDVGTRKRALAFRLELLADRWQCTALRVG